MVIPAIDFQGGAVVQLVQGERTALERDLEATLAEFAPFPVLQIIDLDAAKGEGGNGAGVRRCCQAGHRVRVGGGIRSLERAREVLDWGAEQVIVSSAAFRDGQPDHRFLGELAAAVRPEAVIIAVDSRGGRVAIGGWRKLLEIGPVEAMAALAPYCAEFLYTHVDTEGMLQGLPLEAVRQVRAGTRHRLSVAGGIASIGEIEALEALGCNSVLGMAIYTGKLKPTDLLRFTVSPRAGVSPSR